MSSIFGKPKTPSLPAAAPEPEPEPVQMIEEDAESARRKKKKKLSEGGKGSTILSGIHSALKKRLGE